jgi:hypothetical protein
VKSPPGKLCYEPPFFLKNTPPPPHRSFKRLYNLRVAAQTRLALRNLIAAIALAFALAGCGGATTSDAKTIITINFTALPHETVDLTADSENDLSRARQDILRIRAEVSPVRWFINGEEQTETGGAITIAAVERPVGTHHVTALAYKEGIPYSDELIFKVVK